MVYFLIGASLYLYRHQPLRVPTSVLWTPSSLILLIVPLWYPQLTLYPNIVTGIGCAAFFLWIRRFGIHDKLTLWIAKVSYSPCLIHVPILLWVFKYWNLTGWVGLLVAFSSIFVLAEISWRIIEAPSQRLGKRLASKYEIRRSH